MERITLEWDKTGKVKIEVEGVVGSSCDSLTAALEQAMGKEEKRENKPEYYQDEPIKVGR